MTYTNSLGLGIGRIQSAWTDTYFRLDKSDLLWENFALQLGSPFLVIVISRKAKPTSQEHINVTSMVHASLNLLVLLLPANNAFITTSLTQRPLPVTFRGVHLGKPLWSVAPKEDEKQVSTFSDSEALTSIIIKDLEDDDILPSLVVIEKVDHLEENKNQKLGIWAARGILLLVAILWGTNFASVKYLETLCFHPPCNHPPSEAALARFGVAALVSIPLLIGKRKDVIFAGLECGLWVTIGYITQAMALQTISSGKCAFICSLAVVVVPLLSALFGKPIKLVNIASAVVALTGVGVLEGLIDVSSLATALTGATPALAVPSITETSSLTEAAVVNGGGFLGSIASSIGVSKGDILALGQPLGFGFSFMRIEHYVEKFEDVENRILTISAAECIMVGFCSLLWVLYDFHGTIPNFGYMVRFIAYFSCQFDPF